jgi:hypothetical protein
MFWTLPAQTRAQGHWRPWEPPSRDGIPGDPAFSQPLRGTCPPLRSATLQLNRPHRPPLDQDRNTGPQFRGMLGSRAAPSLRYNGNAGGGARVNEQASCPLPVSRRPTGFSLLRCCETTPNVIDNGFFARAAGEAPVTGTQGLRVDQAEAPPDFADEASEECLHWGSKGWNPMAVVSKGPPQALWPGSGPGRPRAMRIK